MPSIWHISLPAASGTFLPGRVHRSHLSRQLLVLSRCHVPGVRGSSSSPNASSNISSKTTVNKASKNMCACVLCLKEIEVISFLSSKKSVYPRSMWWKMPGPVIHSKDRIREPATGIQPLPLGGRERLGELRGTLG